MGTAGGSPSFRNIPKGFRKKDGGDEEVGGYGSGRWGFHGKADTVEDALVADVSELTRKGLIPREPIFRTGYLRWTMGEVDRASVTFDVDTRDEEGAFVRFYYTSNGNPKDYRVRLERTRPHLGGVRWWWRCPVVGCGRRVQKLYLPPAGPVLACRTCHHLTYKSAQEHDSRVDALLRNDGAGLDAARRGNLSPSPETLDFRSLLLAVKAEGKMLAKMEKKSRKAR